MFRKSYLQHLIWPVRPKDFTRNLRLQIQFLFARLEVNILCYIGFRIQLIFLYENIIEKKYDELLINILNMIITEFQYKENLSMY